MFVWPVHSRVYVYPNTLINVIFLPYVEIGISIMSGMYLDACVKSALDFNSVFGEPEDIYVFMCTVRRVIQRELGLDSIDNEVVRCTKARNMDKLKVLKAMNKIIFQHFNFRPAEGNQYYKLENSIIDLVVKRRRGKSYFLMEIIMLMHRSY